MCGFLKNYVVFAVLYISFSSFAAAEQVRINSARFIADEAKAKVILDVSSSPKHRVFVLDNPSRLVIDVKDAQTSRTLSQPSASHPLFAKMRTAAKNESDLRIVVSLKQPVTAKSFKLASNNADNHHLIIDLTSKNGKINVEKSTNQPEQLADNKTKSADEKVEKTAKSKRTGVKNRLIVAIDAGHGGDDPGAQGPNGTHEKKVTLAIAKKLAALINGQSGMKAKLIRKGDYYVGLRERIKLARQAKADLFISIHADACDDPDVKGASVYTLSRTGASNEAARWLASSENAKEKVGGVNLDDKDDVLASVLLDLSQTATQQASINLASKVLKNFQHIGDLHYNNIQNAGFVVLKSPDIPSILVETAYISNPSDELNLLSGRYQTKMANAIFKGVLNYFEQMDPAESHRMAKL